MLTPSRAGRRRGLLLAITTAVLLVYVPSPARAADTPATCTPVISLIPGSLTRTSDMFWSLGATPVDLSCSNGAAAPADAVAAYRSELAQLYVQRWDVTANKWWHASAYYEGEDSTFRNVDHPNAYDTYRISWYQWSYPEDSDTPTVVIKAGSGDTREFPVRPQTPTVTLRSTKPPKKKAAKSKRILQIAVSSGTTGTSTVILDKQVTKKIKVHGHKRTTKIWKPVRTLRLVNGHTSLTVKRSKKTFYRARTTAYVTPTINWTAATSRPVKAK